jgi:hypothetical protein
VQQQQPIQQTQQPAYPPTPNQGQPGQTTNADYDRVWSQMSQLWDQMAQRMQTSGLESDWAAFWTKLTNTLEPYLQQFSQQISEVLGVAVQQQQQQVMEQGQIVQQVQDSISQLFSGDKNAQQAVQTVVDSFFSQQAQAQQQQQQQQQQPRPTNLGK